MLRKNLKVLGENREIERQSKRKYQLRKKKLSGEKIIGKIYVFCLTENKIKAISL